MFVVVVVVDDVGGTRLRCSPVGSVLLEHDPGAARRLVEVGEGGVEAEPCADGIDSLSCLCCGGWQRATVLFVSPAALEKVIYTSDINSFDIRSQHPVQSNGA